MNESATPLTVRVGAAGIYTLVGLVIGIVLAIAMLALNPERVTQSFATIVFGTCAITATLAAVFPGAALSALAPLANFAWGVITGSMLPESITKPELRTANSSKLMFWLGVAVGCLLLLTWLAR